MGRSKERQCVGGRWTGNLWEELRIDGVWEAGGQGTYGKSYSLRSDRSTSPPVKCQEELFQLSDELFAR